MKARPLWTIKTFCVYVRARSLTAPAGRGNDVGQCPGPQLDGPVLPQVVKVEHVEAAELRGRAARRRQAVDAAHMNFLNQTMGNVNDG